MEDTLLDHWNEQKKKLNHQKKYQHPRAGEIWWCCVGMNIGSEVYGKGLEYSRPVLIVNADGQSSFIGIPLSSRLKKTKYRCIIRSFDGRCHSALLYQVKNFDKRRLLEKFALVSEEEIKTVTEKLKKVLKIL